MKVVKSKIQFKYTFQKTNSVRTAHQSGSMSGEHMPKQVKQSIAAVNSTKDGEDDDDEANK